jgi:uncharacterized protein with ParB-like and HNH nuclease domain
MSQMLTRSSIEAEKKAVQRVFSDLWFVVPEYQRSYVWEEDNINELLDDLWFAFENKNESEYFLGSLVLRDLNNRDFTEYEVLDGQQRLTTLLMLTAVIRDSSTNQTLIKAYNNMIFQEEDPFSGVPERVRIVYRIRDKVEEFIKKYIIEQSGTTKTDELTKLKEVDNISISHMASAILTISEFFKDKTEKQIEEFAIFLSRRVVFIYVSTENREDAFRLFTILNNRGVPLTNADILKSINIGEIQDENENKKYATIWEQIEGSLGEDFDRFLSFIRTVLVQEKARVNLLEEFEENIYKKKLLQKGKQTIQLLERYKKLYDELLRLEGNYLTNEYKNLITIMLIGLPSEDWIPPLLYFYDKFGEEKLFPFLSKLEYKFAGDWILQKTPTERIENMNAILKRIKEVSKAEDVLNTNSLFEIDNKALRAVLKEDVYGRRFARYILLKYEYLISDHTVHLSDYQNISVEHILPQNPGPSSQWRKDFTEEERKNWTHKLANLVLISKRKNSRLSNLDFVEKKDRYLKSRIDIFSGSKIFIQQSSDWNTKTLEKRQEEMLKKLIK